MKRQVIFLFLISFQACLSPEQIVRLEDENLAAFDQILLSLPEESKGQWKKSVTFNGKTEEHVFLHDSLRLAKDLDLFSNVSFVHLIRPASHDKTITDSGQKITYRRKPSENAGPTRLTIEQGAQGEWKKVEVQFTTHNFLYHSSQEVTLTFQKGWMNTYQIKETRKLIGLSVSHYLIKAHRIGW